MKKLLFTFCLAFLTMSAFAMEIPSYSKTSSLTNREDGLGSAIESTSAENPYSFMQEITNGIGENKKIKQFHSMLINEDLNTSSFLEKFFDAKKINFIAREKACSTDEAKKILDSVPSPKVTFPEAEIAFYDQLPQSTKKTITHLIKSDAWFKGVPVTISFAPEFDVIAYTTPQNATTKTLDIAVGPLFYYCCSTDIQKVGCVKHELAHAKLKHSQLAKCVAALLPKSDVQPFKRMLEYEADLFAAVQDLPSAFAVEATLQGLKTISNSEEFINKATIASQLPAKLRDSLTDTDFSSKSSLLTKKAKADYPSIELRYLNAKLVRGLLTLESQKGGCHLM